MAEGTDNVEDRLSCDDSSYSERGLEVYNSGNVFKVVGKAQAPKSNLHNFWYRCLVVALIDVSEVLAQTLHDCMTYERKEKPKIRVKFQVQLIN